MIVDLEVVIPTGINAGKTYREVFEASIDRTGTCHEWTKRRFRQGYGNFYYRGRCYGAHRIAVLIATGRMPTKFVLHNCDNPPCCNPDHLREGSQSENVQDCLRRNRHQPPRGERCGRAKLTENLVRQAHEMRKAGATQRHIADQIRVTPAQVSRILAGKRWSHVRT